MSSAGRATLGASWWAPTWPLTSSLGLGSPSHLRAARPQSSWQDSLLQS